MSRPGVRPPRRPGPPLDVRLREAGHDDLAALERLERLGFADPWPVSALAAEIALETSRVRVAERPGQNEVLGYLAVRRLPDAAELLRVAVAPSHRRRGLGGNLVAEALRIARRWGLATCLLEVRAENLPARRLYERAGFRLTGRRRRYYPGGTDALLYARPTRGSGATAAS